MSLACCWLRTSSRKRLPVYRLIVVDEKCSAVQNFVSSSLLRAAQVCWCAWESREMSVGRRVQSITLALSLAMPCSAAIAQTSSAAKIQPQAERALLAAAEHDPGNVQVVSSLGEYYLHREKWREGVYWLTQAYAVSSGSESIEYDLAFACMHAGELENAKRQIQQMLAQTDSARLHNLLGEIEERRSNDLNALKEYHRAAEIDPSESNVFDLATFLLGHKKYVGFVDESIKFFRYGVSKYPRSSQMMVGLGVALYASEQYDEALRTLCAAVDMDPRDRRPIEFLGKARRVSPELAKEVDRRLQDFAQRYPENAAMSYYYAVSLWDRGGGEEGRNLVKIETLLRKAQALSPKWYEPDYQLGVLYEQEKRYSEAIGAMERAVKINSEFYPAHFRLAVLYQRTGDKAKAAHEAAIVQRLKDRDRKIDTSQETDE